MKINIINDYENLPNSLKDRINANTSEGFESLSKSLQTLPKIEIEKEIEIEIKKGNRKGKSELNFNESFSLLINDESYHQAVMDYDKRFTNSIDIIEMLKKFFDRQKATGNHFPAELSKTKAYFVNWLAKQEFKSNELRLDYVLGSPKHSRR